MEMQPFVMSHWMSAFCTCVFSYLLCVFLLVAIEVLNLLFSVSSGPVSIILLLWRLFLNFCILVSESSVIAFLPFATN